MKPGAREFWGISGSMQQFASHLSSRAAIALLLALASLFTLVGCTNGESSARPAASLHITQAEWQTTASPGFSAAPATLDQVTLPAAWQSVELPHALSVSLLRQAAAASPDSTSTTRTTWYRLPVTGLPPMPGPLALYAARVRTDGTIAVYADGRLVHTAQQQGPLWNSSRTPLWVVLDPAADGAAPREILIRLEHSRATQVALSSVRLGPVDALSWRHSWRH